jgi:hypothetical protein
MPAALTWVAKFLPLTHGLALMRYGVLRNPSGLHNIWGMSNASAMAFLSLVVMGVFAFAMSVASIRVFTRAALH